MRGAPDFRGSSSRSLRSSPSSQRLWGAELAILTGSRVALAVLLLGGFSLLGMAGAVRGYQHTKRARWTGWTVMGATLGVPLPLAFMPLPIGGAV